MDKERNEYTLKPIVLKSKECELCEYNEMDSVNYYKCMTCIRCEVVNKEDNFNKTTKNLFEKCIHNKITTSNLNDVVDNIIEKASTLDHLDPDNVLSIKEYMSRNALTQRELARRSKVTDVTMSRYIHGTRVPNMEIAKRMADALGISTDHLYISLACKKEGSNNMNSIKLENEHGHQFICGITKKIDLFSSIKMTEDYHHYISIYKEDEFNDEYISIRVPGHTCGHIHQDTDHNILDIELYTTIKLHNIYPASYKDMLQEFIGKRLVL